PFERERYWIETETRRDSAKEKASHVSANVTPVSSGGPAPQETTVDDWIYDLVWHPKPLAQKISSHSTATLDKELLRQLATTPATPELTRMDNLTAKLMPIYGTSILQAFKEAGLSPLPISDFTVDELGQWLKVIPARRRVLNSLLDILVEDNIVEKIGDRFRFVDFKPRPDDDRELERLSVEYPEGWAELNILRRCGK